MATLYLIFFSFQSDSITSVKEALEALAAKETVHMSEVHQTGVALDGFSTTKIQSMWESRISNPVPQKCGWIQFQIQSMWGPISNPVHVHVGSNFAWGGGGGGDQKLDPFLCGMVFCTCRWL